MEQGQNVVDVVGNGRNEGPYAALLGRLHELHANYDDADANDFFTSLQREIDAVNFKKFMLRHLSRHAVFENFIAGIRLSLQLDIEEAERKHGFKFYIGMRQSFTTLFDFMKYLAVHPSIKISCNNLAAIHLCYNEGRTFSEKEAVEKFKTFWDENSDPLLLNGKGGNAKEEPVLYCAIIRGNNLV